MCRVSNRLLVIILVLLVVEVANISQVNAVASVAIIVYDHGLSEKPTWTLRYHFIANKTSSFTQDDPVAYAYVTVQVSSANVAWLWYDPVGELYKNDTRQIQCEASPCTFLSWLGLARSEATARFGLWTVSFQAGGSILYSDHFSVTQVVWQENGWKFYIKQSAPARVRGELTVTIHPRNQTWSSYAVNLPFAANITAHEYASNRTLDVKTFNGTSRVVVDLGAPRFDGYTFVLIFDVQYGLVPLGGWETGHFAFTWLESSWGTFNDGYHPIPESFDVTLPKGTAFVDAVGLNTMTLNQSVTSQTISFTTTLLPDQLAKNKLFGWTIIYNDFTYLKLHPVNSTSIPTTLIGLNVAASQRIPVLPLTIGSVSIWTAVMSVFLLTASELLSPVYARTGILINRRRLRIAAMILVTIFLVSVAYQIILSQSIATQIVR
jgi:hypothetical protein